MASFCHVPFFFIFVFLLASFYPARARAGQPDVDGLIALSREKNLSEDRYWHILMHYRKTLFGFRSQVDDPRYFLAPDGKTNPRAELESSITALFQPDDGAAASYVCRFYGRYMWLRETLAIPADAFADRMCPEIDRIDPVTATLVFPSSYLNNPASMFGHTLLAINTEYENRRLAYAVNYAARVDTTSDLAFAFNGLFGLFQGYYSVDPYYKKIQEYGDINQRDIWEYPLNLTPDEIRRLIRHVKEFDKGVYTDYFFFDENCSYNLLFLMEAARPSVDLVSRFDGPAVLPLDTVREIGRAGLIADAVFRPSKATRIRHAMETLDPVSVESALDVINGRMAPAEVGTALPSLAADRQAGVLDLAAEQLQYLLVKKDIDRETYQERFLQTLKARSKLGIMNGTDDEEIPPPPRPDTGHDSGRISLAGGESGGDVFGEVRYRPAFTDVLDMDHFQNQGAQIEFIDARLRYFAASGRLKLQQMDIIDIISIPGRDDFFKPLSWKVDTGFHRKPMADGDESLYYRLNGGTGLAAELPVSGITYAMVTAEADVSGAMEKNYAMGPGATCGLIKTITPEVKMHLYGEIKGFALGDTHTEQALAFSNNLKVSKNNHLAVELKWSHVRQWAGIEASGVWHVFF
ncbi:MAG: DUF4105 domain-containing protein [Thermodesulfobacteriota bacterium]